MSELCDHEETCVLLKEMKKGYYMKNSELREENTALKNELKYTAKTLQNIAQKLLKTTLVFMFLVVSVLPLTAQSPSNKQRAYESFLEWRKVYDIDKDYGITKKEGEYPRLINFPYFEPATVLDTAWVYQGQVVNIMDSVARCLSKWDVVQCELHHETTPQNLHRKLAFHSRIKEYNPDVKLFLYLCLGTHVPYATGIIDGLLARMFREKRWFFYDTSDQIFPMWTNGIRNKYDGGPPNYHIPACAGFVAGLVDSIFTASGDIYNGLWIDLLRGHFQMVKWLRDSALDVNNNGVHDTLDYGFDVVVEGLQKNYVVLLDSLRGRLGKDKIIFGNPGVPWGLFSGGWKQDSLLYAAFNGNEIQGNYEINGWVESGMKGAIYNQNHANPVPQRFFEMDYQTQQTCCCPDTARREVRYTLTAALMTEAYYSYSTSSIFKECQPQRNFYQTLWWPEYNINLGYAKSDFTVTTTLSGDTYFSRDFEHGKAILNNNDKPITIKLKKRMHDISGDKLKSITVPPKDGRILLHTKPWYRKPFITK